MAEPPLISLRFGRIGFGGRLLFEDAELRLGRGDRACLVGRNGSGKTTLMKALAGQIELDGGEPFLQPGTRLAYLPQDPRFDPETTVAEHVAADGAPAHRVEAMLNEVQLDGGRALGTLSGGEARRAAIARALVGEPEILFLDEPTNHLDLAAIEWLERLLLGRGGALLVVSHDRTFLTRVTNRIYWLERAKLRRAERGFADFERWTEQILNDEAKAAERLDVKLAEETRWLLRGITARRRRNEGRLRKLEELRTVRAALIGGRGKAKIKVEETEIRSKLVIEAKDIKKSFTTPDGTERPIVGGFSTRILRGDRIGIIGPNGAGKTTLLRMLTGDLPPDAGKVTIAKHLTTAYFDQHRATLDPAASLWETLCPGGGDSVMVHGRQRHVRAYLKDFLFDPRALESPVSSLSGGERNRLLLAKILATPADLLVLDEPTNDLDMDTLDLLQEVLADFAGTIILVSHDRDFLDRTVTSTIALEGDGVAIEYPGGYADYLRQKKERARPARPAASAPKPPAEPTARPARERMRLSYKDQRELDLLPERIEALTSEIAALETALADPGLYERDRARFDRTAQRLEAARAERAAAEDRWIELEALREAMASQ